MGLGNDFLITGLQCQQRRPDAADIGAALKAENLLNNGVHVSLRGAHLVDDTAAFILDFPALLQFSSLETAENFQIQLRHGGIGSADSSGGSGGKAASSIQSLRASPAAPARSAKTAAASPVFLAAAAPARQTASTAFPAVWVAQYAVPRTGSITLS